MPTLVLLRHGQSAWNLENRFTGWWDVNLTPQGEQEAKAAGELLAAKGFDFDLCFTSFQTRAIKTLNIALEAMGRLWLPVEKHWRLNERHYGGLTGLDKAETAAKHGEEQVKAWRRSFDIPPPAMEPGGAFDLTNDRRYRGIDIPSTESLKDTIARVLPYWEERIVPALNAGERIGRPDEPAEQLRHMDESGAGGELAVTVVDRGKVAELDVEQGGRRSVALRLSYRPFQFAEESTAIGERRQRVEIRGLLELIDTLAHFSKRGAQERILVGKLRRPFKRRPVRFRHLSPPIRSCAAAL